MAGRIPQAFVDDLIARADIVEVIGSRVPLKKAGREYKACCPFHDEKTPSFWVSPDKQFYHCFGCGAHGTALGFLMQYDQLPFPEAVEELAGRLGLTVPHEGGGPSGPADEFAPLYLLMAAVAEFFADNLARTERGRAYAHSRGLSTATLKDFQIGYAPEAWDELLHRFGGSPDARRALAACGLIIERDAGSGRSGYYDRFRGRLMFPIRDNRGRVIAFGGRVIDQGEPKYLNSPETAVFHKGRELYGLYETRIARTALKRLLVVEGYMDVVQLQQVGIRYAVATLGTATTAEHLHRAFRLVSEVVFAFDGDRAGRAAAWRALQNALPEARAGREIRFLFLPEGEDPDSLARREGEAFENRLAATLPLSEYLVTHLREDSDLSHADGRARFVAAARPLLEKVEAGVYRELLLERVAAEIGWTADRLSDALAGTLAAAVPASAIERAAAAANPARARVRRAGRGGLVTQAIQLLLHFPKAHTGIGTDAIRALEAVEVPGIDALRVLLEELLAQPAASTAQVLERWRDRPEYRRLCELAAEPVLIEPAAAARELRDAVHRLIDGVREQRLNVLLARAEALNAEEKLELQRLTVALSRTSGTGNASGNASEERP
jgi:DNA primase